MPRRFESRLCLPSGISLLGSQGSEADLANPLSQPALPKGDTFDGVNFGELEYHFFKGQASTGKYEYTDVIQGEIGDCFFLSSSVAINAVDSNSSAATWRTSLTGRTSSRFSTG